MKICINLRVFSERLLVSSNGGGGADGLATVGWGQHCSVGMGVNSGGGQQLEWGSSTSRTALQTIIISLQNSLS